jgi:hypothetical protein
MATTTWTGAIDNDWDDAGNWSGVVPGSADDAIIADVDNQPIMNVNGTVSTIVINSGATLDLNGKTLTFKSAFTNNGTLLDTGGGLVIFDPFATGNIDAGGADDQHALPALTVRFPSTTLTMINTDMQIDGQLYQDLTGNFVATGRSLKLGSIRISSGADFTKGLSLTFFKDGGTIRDDNATSEDLGDVIIDGFLSLDPAGVAVQVTNLVISALKQLNINGELLQISRHLIAAPNTILNSSGTIKFNGTGMQLVDAGDNFLGDVEVAAGSILVLQNNLRVNDLINNGEINCNGFLLKVNGTRTGSGIYSGDCIKPVTIVGGGYNKRR